MTVSGAIVLFAVLWFLVLFCVLPYRFRSQADAGSIVPGTPASAPADFNPGRIARATTVITFVLWAGITAVVLSEVITVRDLDVFNRMPPPSAAETGG